MHSYTYKNKDNVWVVCRRTPPLYDITEIAVRGDKANDDDKPCIDCLHWRPAAAFDMRNDGVTPCAMCTTCLDMRQECRYQLQQWKEEQKACKECGEAFKTTDAVDVDHVDDEKKKHEFTNFAYYMTTAAIQGGDPVQHMLDDLADNAQLLHHRCHKEKTRRKMQWKQEHVTTWARELLRDQGPRTCTSCAHTRPAHEFVSIRTRKPSWALTCSSCRASGRASKRKADTQAGSIREAYRAHLDLVDGLPCQCGCPNFLRVTDVVFIVLNRDLGIRIPSPQVPMLSEARTRDELHAAKTLRRPVTTACYRRLPVGDGPASRDWML